MFLHGIIHIQFILGGGLHALEIMGLFDICTKQISFSVELYLPCVIACDGAF